MFTKIKTFTDNGMRVMGEVDYNAKLFRKRVDRRKHLFKKANAWGINAKMFKMLVEKMGEFKIKIYDEFDRKIYTTTSKDYQKENMYLNFGDLQVFLPIDKFRIENY